MAQARKPTPEDMDLWQGLAARRPARLAAPSAGPQLVGGPREGESRAVGAATVALIFRDGAERHRYVRSGPQTFTYVGSW